MVNHIWLTTYDQPYMTHHIWSSIYSIFNDCFLSYMHNHIWLLIYGYSYMDSHIRKIPLGIPIRSQNQYTVYGEPYMVRFSVIYRHVKSEFFYRIWWTIYDSVQRSYTGPYMVFFDHIWLFWKIPYMVIFPYMIHHIWQLPYMIAYMVHLPGEMIEVLITTKKS